MNILWENIIVIYTFEYLCVNHLKELLQLDNLLAKYRTLGKKYLHLEGEFSRIELKNRYKSRIASYLLNLSLSPEVLEEIENICKKTTLEQITEYELCYTIDYQLSESFNLSEFKSKYRELILKFHPDKGGNEVIFDRIKNTYDKTSFIIKLRRTPDKDISVWEFFRELKQITDIYNITLNIFEQLGASDNEKLNVFDEECLIKRKYGNLIYYGCVGLGHTICLGIIGAVSYGATAVLGFWPTVGLGISYYSTRVLGFWPTLGLAISYYSTRVLGFWPTLGLITTCLVSKK
jgi:hypothetical protein